MPCNSEIVKIARDDFPVTKHPQMQFLGWDLSTRLKRNLGTRYRILRTTVRRKRKARREVRLAVLKVPSATLHAEHRETNGTELADPILKFGLPSIDALFEYSGIDEQIDIKTDPVLPSSG